MPSTTAPLAPSPALQTPLCQAPEIPLLLSVPYAQKGRDEAQRCADCPGNGERVETQNTCGWVSRVDHLEGEGNPSPVPLPRGRKRGTGDRKKREPVAREREAEIRRVCLGHIAAQRKDIHQSQAPPPLKARSRLPPLVKNVACCRVLFLPS